MTSVLIYSARWKCVISSCLPITRTYFIVLYVGYCARCIARQICTSTNARSGKVKMRPTSSSSSSKAIENSRSSRAIFLLRVFLNVFRENLSSGPRLVYFRLFSPTSLRRDSFTNIYPADVDKAPRHFIESNKLAELLWKRALIPYLKHFPFNIKFHSSTRRISQASKVHRCLLRIINNRTNEASYKSEIECPETFDTSIVT